ncbi:MAG: aminotransferase class V-fold PLP-dependent enzyme [Rickettsiales bacterium]
MRDVHPTDMQSPASEFSDVSLPVYLDNQSSTPLDPRVADYMEPFLREKFGNPHAGAHRYGWEAEAAVDVARENVAALIGAEAGEIIFTSGATESCNFAIKGACAYAPKERRTIVVSSVEHKCVLETAEFMRRAGFRVAFAPVDEDGIVRMEALKKRVDDDVFMVSVMAANNEIGTIQPVAEIGALCREKGALFHCDAAQAAGKIPIDVRASHIDLLSVSAHKMYGPKGIGALYVRRKPRVRLEPLLHGGGQERGLRSGTVPTMLAAGFGEAARIGKKALADGEPERIRLLSRLFIEEIRVFCPNAPINGCETRRLPGNVNMSFPGIDAGALIASLREVAASAGSACASSGTESSYVLKALGVSQERVAGAVRFSLGRFTTEREARFAARAAGIKAVQLNLARK